MDITMCKGAEYMPDTGLVRYCAKRHQCERYTATPNPNRQSWFMGTPISMVNYGHDCPKFVDNEQHKK